MPLSNTTSGSICIPPASLIENATQPLVGDVTFYQFNIAFSGTCTALASAIAFLLIFLHGIHFSNPAQQIKIIRITMMIPVYSIYSFLCVLWPQAQVSMVPWQDVVQAFALGNFFLLLLELISPHEDQRSLFFAGMDLPTAADQGFSFGRRKKEDPQKPKKPKKPVDVLAWYRRKWIFTFQFVLVAILIGIITDITEATNTYCDSSYSPHFAHLWMVILQNISEATAITAVILLYQATKKHLATHRPLAKLFAFKGIIGITFLTGILFTILRGTGAMKPTQILTYADIKVGIPTLVLSFIMVPFSIFFHWAYSYRFYVISGPHALESGRNDINPAPGYTPSYQGGFLGVRAYLYAINPIETIQAIIFAFKLYMPASRAYVRRRMQGKDGAAYANHLQKGNSKDSGSELDMPSYEPMRDPASHSNDLGVVSSDYDTLNSKSPLQSAGHLQPGGYHAVPDPAGNSNGGYAGHYSDARDGRGVSPPSRTHSRSPSREQFLPPPAPQGGVQPGAYGPLGERERY